MNGSETFFFFFVYLDPFIMVYESVWLGLRDDIESLLRGDMDDEVA